LPIDFPNDKTMRISHEAIYQALFVQAGGATPRAGQKRERNSHNHGRRLSLNALAVFIALAFWTWLCEADGGFLSSPLLIVAIIVKDHLTVTRRSSPTGGLGAAGTYGATARLCRTCFQFQEL